MHDAIVPARLSTRLLAAIIGGCVGAGLACAERTLDDDIEQLCANACASGLECGYNDSDPTEEACFTRCVPDLKERRNKYEETCPTYLDAYFSLKRCISALTCDEYDTFVDGFNGEYDWENKEYVADFPCENEYLNHGTAVVQCPNE